MGVLGDSTPGLVGVASARLIAVGLKGVTSVVVSVRDFLFGALGGGLVGIPLPKGSRGLHFNDNPKSILRIVLPIITFSG